MSMHTPGPWRFSDGVIDADPHERSRRPVICQLINADHLDSYASQAERDVEADANGRLLAAAPELLAALENLLPHITSEIEQRKYGGNDEDWAAFELLANAAHAAIAKAKGVA